MVQLVSTLAAFLVILGFGNLFELIKAKIVWLEHFFFGAHKQLALFFGLYLVLLAFGSFGASCLYFKWRHYTDVKMIITHFDTTTIDGFITDPSNRQTIHRMAQRFPNRRDWQAAVDHLITRARVDRDDDDSFRRLSRFAVSAAIGVDDVSKDAVLPKMLGSLISKRPFCWCTTQSAIETSPQPFMLKLMAQGFRTNPERGDTIAMTWVDQYPADRALQIYRPILEIFQRFVDFHDAYETSGTHPEMDVIAALKSSVHDLETQLSSILRNDFFGSDFHFLALDALAQSEIYLCQHRGSRDDDRIYKHYETFLEARATRMGRDQGVPIWLREPQKFFLFWQINSAAEKSTKHGVDEAFAFFDRLCPGYFDPLTARLSVGFPALAGKEYAQAWHRNTAASLHSEDITVKLFKPSQIQGWRY